MTLVKDLLRRRVPQVAAIYIGACWGLVEFMDFFTQRFALSPNLVDLALVGPLLLLPSVLLVTYFHGAPGQDEWVMAEKIGIPANLVVAMGFLVFLFQGKDLGAATTKVTVTDEEGVEEVRVVPKTEFRKRITLYYFDAEPTDTAATWLQYGLPIALLTDLTQDHFLDVRAPADFSDRLREAGFEELVNVPLPLAREISEEQHREYFVTGEVATVDGEIEATVFLYETARGRLVGEQVYSGTDVLDLADEVASQLRVDLEIPDLGEKGIQDLPVVDLLTESPAAYRTSIEGFRAAAIERDFPEAIALFEKAVAEDPTYADAQSGLAGMYMMTNQLAESARPLRAAMEHIYKLPERTRFIVKHNYYFIVREDIEKAWAVLDMWADLFPDDTEAHNARLLIQTLNDDKEGALASLQTILELDPAQRDVLLRIGNLQEAMGDFAGARASFQEYADEFPEDHGVLTQLATLSRREGDFVGAREYFERALLLEPSDVGITVGMAGLERAMGDFDATLDLLADAQAMASTPEEQAQVHAAYEAYYGFRGQLGARIERMEQRLAEAAAYQAPFTLVRQKVTEAGTYAAAGRVEEALALAEMARTQLPEPFNLLAYMGEMRVHLTLESADAVEATFPGVETFITTLQYEVFRPALVFAQGRVHELRGEYREAIERYEEERRLSPSDASVPMHLGRCFRELGELDRALALMHESLRPSPFHPEYNYEMALTYEAMGQMEEARTHLDRALEVWVDADEGYKPAQLAQEALARVQGGRN